MAQSRRSVTTVRPLLQREVKRLEAMPDELAALDRETYATIHGAIRILIRDIPGFRPPPDAKAAETFLLEAQECRNHSYQRFALIACLHGLQNAPHQPQLWDTIAQVCLDLDEEDLAKLCLMHSLWINPGNIATRRQLDELQSEYDEDSPTD